MYDNRTPQSLSIWELPPHQILGLIVLFGLGVIAWFLDLVVRHGLIAAVKMVIQIVGGTVGF
jgi:hypothetical protein